MRERVASDRRSLESTGDRSGATPAPDSAFGDELDLAARSRMAALRESMFSAQVERVRVDRFLVLETLGAGGMGVVHAAYDPRLDRKIALKLVKPDAAAGTRAEARLLREAQAMARLSHPNVVQIHEVGAWEGRVFIAMELVGGHSLAAWLTARPRTWREIVAVFVAAGQGLAAAHAVGIVHRDFKPENVLVGHDGRVRVTDFGLARGSADEPARPDPWTDPCDPLTQLAAGSSVATATVAGTPRYMSPEQFLGEPATPASDQFSFCVALYQALHGQFPFAGDDRTALARSVLAGDRRPPSRRIVPRRLHQALLRGLSRAPEARFPTMEALLAALAVRSPWLALAAAAVLALGTTAAFLTTDPDPCADASGLLAGTWDPARRAAVQRAYAASAITDAALLSASTTRMLDDYRDSAADIYVRSCQANHIDGSSARLHDLRVGCLRRRLAVMRGVVTTLAAGAPTALREGPKAASRLDDLAACDDDRSLLDGVAPPPPDQALAQRVLRARLADARARSLLGDLTGSAELLAGLLVEARALAYAPTLAEVLHELGEAALDARESARARDALQEALDLAVSSHHDTLVLSLWPALINATIQARGELGDARASMRQADAWRERLGASHSANFELTRSIVHQFAGESAEAEAASRRAVELLETTLGPDHLATARARITHGNQLAWLGHSDRAIAPLRAALATISRVVGQEHMLLADALYALGAALSDPSYLAARRQSLTPDRRASLLSSAHYALGAALSDLAEFTADTEALLHLQRAQAIVRAQLGEQALELADGHLAIARIEHRRGDLTHAERGVAAALAIYAFHPDHPDRAYALTFHGSLLTAQERFVEALAAHREALAIFAASQGEAGDSVGFARYNIAEVLLARGDREAAVPELETAITTIERAQGADAPMLRAPLLRYGSVQLERGAACEALALFDRAAAIATGDDLDIPRAQAHAACARLAEP